MKKYFTIAFSAIASFSWGQIGIGTSSVNPNITLQVESIPYSGSTSYGGILFPRIALTAANVFAPVTGTPITGLIVYNTSVSGTGNNAVTPGLYFWDNAKALWSRMAQKDADDTALFSNQDINTDLNNGINYADLFANIRFNNDTNLYEKVNNTTLKINEVGYYKLILNLDLTNRDGTNDNFGIKILVNGATNIVTDQFYIPGRATQNASVGKSIVYYIPINTAGSTLRFQAYEIDPGTEVYFKNPNTSTVSIQRLR